MEYNGFQVVSPDFDDKFGNDHLWQEINTAVESLLVPDHVWNHESVLPLMPTADSQDARKYQLCNDKYVFWVTEKGVLVVCNPGSEYGFSFGIVGKPTLEEMKIVVILKSEAESQ